jgi:hypothetical protein
LVFDQGQASVGAVNGMFTVPQTAETGLSRMRVQMVYQGQGSSSLPNNCGTFQSGETEDYCVVIKAGSASLSNEAMTVLQIFPNPASNLFTVTTQQLELTHIQVVSLSGQAVMLTTINNGSAVLDVQHLGDGVYFVYALSEAGVCLSAQKLIVTK